MRVIGYTRVSTEEQERDGHSLGAQEQRIRAWALANGAELVDIVRDEPISGSKPLASREGGARIAKLLDARKPDADAVVVVRMDRLGRDASEQLGLLKRFRTGAVGVVAITQSIDLATPHGRAWAGMGAIFAQLERELIAERTREGLDELRRQKKAWNHAPFGWTTRDDGTLVEDRTEQATLRRVRALRAEGVSYSRCAGILNDEGRATKKGRPWQAMSVRSVELTSQKLDPAT